MGMGKGKAKEKRRVAWAAMLVALMLLGVVAQQVIAGETNRFCQANYAEGYGPRFEGMRLLRGVPANGRLPFGPGGVQLLPLGLDQTVVDGGSVGFYLEADLKHPRVVDWKIETRLVSVDRSGRPFGVKRERVQRVKEIDDPGRLNLGFKVGGRPGLYRVDIVVRSASNKVLGRYAEYFQAAERVVSVRLALDAPSYKVGEVLLMRLENLGTVMIGFGLEFTLESWNSTAWEVSSATPIGWPSEGYGIGAGRAARCERFLLPAELGAGRYRIVKPYGIGLGGRSSRTTAAEFAVVQ